jgi:citrate synthase
MDDSVRRGLEGVAVAETSLSDIDGGAGELAIRGYPVEELAGDASFAEVLYLLRHGDLPTAEERDALRAALRDRRALAPEVREVLRAAAAADLPAMDAARMGVAAASLVRDGAEDPETDALLVAAQLPTVVATYWRYRRGEEPVAPDPALDHAANYLYMLTGEAPAPAAVDGLEAYLVAVSDHGLNASTFAARTVVSTESDVVSAVTAAVGALKGPLHGGAPGPVLDMIREVRATGDAREWVADRLDAGERLMGFGHRVYRVRDPRAAVLEAAAERVYEAGGTGTDAGLFEAARELERVGVEALRERKPDRRLDTNVEFYTAVLLHGVGVPRDLFSATFAVGRVAGWTAHCLEQLGDNRLIRPSSRYAGERGRTWTPIEER